MRQLYLTLGYLFLSMAMTAQTDAPAEPIPQKTKVIGFDFFSPVTGNATFSYEQYLNNQIGIEGRIGFIGLGKNLENQLGGFLKFGVKFSSQPNGNPMLWQRQRLLQGAYFKPEITTAIYRNDNLTSVLTDGMGSVLIEEQKVEAGFVVQLVAGQQWILNDILVIDVYFGLGYGFTSDNDGYNYGYYLFNEDFPLATSAGLSVGVLLP